MAKVMVIDVDLGINLDGIIAESAQDLTTNARTALDGALAIAESAKRIKDEKTQQKSEQSSGIVTAMDAAYQKLETAGLKGIPVADIVSSVQQFVPNSSAFTLRMNNILSMKGNPYRLIRSKINGVPHYVFTPFNDTNTDETN